MENPKEHFIAKARMQPTDKVHSDMVDAFAYMTASWEAKIWDSYFMLHVKPKPKWMPKKVWEWMLSKLLQMNEFKK